MIDLIYPHQTVYFIEEKDRTIVPAGVHSSDMPHTTAGNVKIRLASSSLVLEKAPAELFSSREEALQALNTLENVLLASYTMPLHTAADLLRFMFDKNIAWFDAHTDWTARQAARQKAQELTGLFLHTKSGTHAFTKNKYRPTIPLGSSVFYIDSRHERLQPARLVSYLRDDQRCFARMIRPGTRDVITTPVEWIFADESAGQSKMHSLLDEEYERCCREIAQIKDLFIFAYSHPVSLESSSLNLPARKALHHRALELLNLDLDKKPEEVLF